jgi:hypothetical protein
VVSISAPSIDFGMSSNTLGVLALGAVAAAGSFVYYNSTHSAGARPSRPASGPPPSKSMRDRMFGKNAPASVKSSFLPTRNQLRSFAGAASNFYTKAQKGATYVVTKAINTIGLSDEERKILVDGIENLKSLGVREKILIFQYIAAAYNIISSSQEHPQRATTLEEHVEKWNEVMPQVVDLTKTNEGLKQSPVAPLLLSLGSRVSLQLETLADATPVPESLVPIAVPV